MLYGASNEVDFRFGIESGRGHCPNGIRHILLPTILRRLAVVKRKWNGGHHVLFAALGDEQAFEFSCQIRFTPGLKNVGN